MAAYSQLILTKDTATFKGKGLDDKTVDVGNITLPKFFSSMYSDFILAGTNRNLAFGAKRGAGTYQVVVTTNPESNEEYIPITAGLIGEAKEQLQGLGKTSLSDDETLEIGTVTTSAGRRSRLNKQGGRTKRNRRGRKGGQTRKLAARRR